jgi:hypothetical protein
MRTKQVCTAALALMIGPVSLFAGTISGKVTVDGPTPKQKVIDMSKEPACAKDYPPTKPPTTETATVGPGNTLADVVVYISAGANDEGKVPSQAVTLDQKGCRYIKHITALQVNQDMKISNSDPTSHNIHPLAKTNREWNKSQPPGTAPLDAKFDQPEFIPVKCNIHPWMHGYIVVLKTGHYSVSDDNGGFSLKDRQVHGNCVAGNFRHAAAGCHDRWRRRNQDD